MDTHLFSELLVQFMQEAGLSSSEMSRRADVNRHTLRRWRSGEIRHPDCDKVLACLPHLRLDRYQQEAFLQAAGCTDAAKALFPGVSEQELSPFVVGQPIIHPRQFCGRQALVQRIMHLWRRLPLQNIALIGPRRSGKSSLLHYLKYSVPQKLSTRYRTILVDFKEARMRSQDSLLQYLLQALKLPVLSNSTLVHFEELVSHHTLEFPTLILMDDIEYGLASDELPREFWWGLRSIQHNYCHGHLGFLLVSRTHPAELSVAHGKSSPFFNVFGFQVEMEAFSDAEARDLLARSPIPFSEADNARIIHEAQGAPEVLQQLCAAHLHELELQAEAGTKI